MAYRRERSSSSSSGSREKLHNFTLPGFNWGATRQLRCMKANPNSRILMHPSLSAAPVTDQSREAETEVAHLEQKNSGGELAVSPEKNSGHMEDPVEDLQKGCEEMRVSEMEEKKKGKEKVAEDDGTENKSGGAWTWNLRTRKNACKGSRGNDGDDVMVDVPAEGVVGSGGGGGGGGGSSPGRRMDGRLRGGAGMGAGVERKVERPKFSFTLTKEEIEDDFLLMTGAKPPLKPKTRPKRLQKKLNDLVPGLWLREEITPATYRVRERQSKKGLK
ncbi:uncharacterized protein LOC108212622 [Daucus carota subsp. sativus]|uniref:uncharacterized protein LOC108212622 n=1 Tax=Daucus carota subsp. sativus TaxID=79200 RepID=UPI00308271C4